LLLQSEQSTQIPALRGVYRVYIVELLALSKRLFAILLCVANIACAEIRTLTVRQALELIARQSPDVLLARLDEQRAREQILVAQDPFRPKMNLGSDAVYTSGYPDSINEEAPRILGSRINMDLYNRPKLYVLAETREQARAAHSALEAKVDDVTYQVISLFLDAQELTGRTQRIQNQLAPATAIANKTDARVSAGYELPVERTRARISMLDIQQRLAASRADQSDAEHRLAVILGFPATDSVRPAGTPEQLNLPPVRSESEAIKRAFQRNKELEQLQSALLAKQIEMASFKAARLPQMDLVAQYSMLRKRDYEDYFPSNSVQRNNGQIGASLVLPLFLGPARGGHLGQSQADFLKLRIQIDQLQNHIMSAVHRSYQELQKAGSALELARQQLDLAGSDFEVQSAQYSEGRALLSQVEKARLSENEYSVAVWGDQINIKRAQLGVLRQLGGLASALLQANSSLGQ
jgi:outer membrane protein